MESPIEGGVQYGPDSWLVKQFFSDDEASQLFEHLTKNAPWIDRNSSLMKMRGNPVPRDLFVYVKKDKNGSTPKYGFPGFQYEAMARFYKELSEDQVLSELVSKIQNRIPGGNTTNHLIGTRYATESDNIGWHSDKLVDIAVDSVIIMISLGDVRELWLGKPDSRDAKKTKTLHQIAFESGDLFVLGPRTNATLRHTIVPVKKEEIIKRTEPCGTRVSLVLREISTMITADELKDRTQKKRKIE